jgi:regulator of protease activity HflC (stomatin/prohibitin superfamily)
LHRLELMGELKSRGVKMSPLICRSAVLGAQCEIGCNAWIGSVAVLEHAVKAGTSAWIDAGVLVGAEAGIGSHAPLGRLVAINYRGDIAMGTHHSAILSTPVLLLNGRARARRGTATARCLAFACAHSGGAFQALPEKAHRPDAMGAPPRRPLQIDIKVISFAHTPGETVMKERTLRSLPGIPLLLGVLALSGLALWLFVSGLLEDPASGAPTSLPLALLSLLLGALALLSLCGLYTVQPNQAAVLSLFGKYVGTVKDNGLRWNNPFYSKKKVSQRVRNFESGRLKVNELDGSPIEIAAVIVWQVIDASEAVYNVDDYESFVHIQSESALRAMATSYPYDQHEDNQISLRSHPAEISEQLKRHLDERLTQAGVDVIEARISHLAYAPEIAQAMLQRQQANAVIAARTRIVSGAVGMVEMALAELEKNGTVQLDEERKAHMVSNLLTVLCSDRGAQPIVNAGSLY